MYVDILNKYDLAAAECRPAVLNPFPSYVPIYQEMKVGDTTLVELKNCDVLHGNTVLPAQIQSKLVEDTAQVSNGIS